MPLHAQCDRLDALQQQEGAHGRQDRAGGALIDAAGAGDEGGAAEALGIDQAVIGCIRRGELREALLVRHPVEAAGIQHHAAHGVAMAAHELGQGMDDDVGAMLRRLEQHGRRHRIVHDQRHAMRHGPCGRWPRYRRYCRRDCPRVSQKTARVFSSMQAASASALSPLAKRPSTPWPGSTECSRVWVVP